MPLANACPWSISIHKFIYNFAKLQMPNTNAMPISIAVAVAVPMAEPMPMLSHCWSCAHGQFQYTDSFILLLNTTYKHLIPMPCPFPLLWLWLLPWLSCCRGCALGRCQCWVIAKAVPMVNLNAQIHTFAKYNLQIPNANAMSIPLLWLCRSPLPSWCWCGALGWCRCRSLILHS